MSDLNIVEPKPAPICCQLRSKGMFVHGTTEEVDTGMPGAGDGYYWCLKTMNLFGPDNELASRQLCKPGRGCYQTV